MPASIKVKEHKTVRIGVYLWPEQWKKLQEMAERENTTPSNYIYSQMFGHPLTDYTVQRHLNHTTGRTYFTKHKLSGKKKANRRTEITKLGYDPAYSDLFSTPKKPPTKKSQE